MSKFKVGDMVATYDQGKRSTGTIEHIFLDRELVTVRFSQWVRVSFHPKQCRRLVKKPRITRERLSQAWDQHLAHRNGLMSFNDDAFFRICKELGL